MKWALVIWALSADNFTVYERFQTVEDCLDKRTMVMKALHQADSKMQLSCRPIKPGGQKARNEIVVEKYTFQF